MKRWVLITIWFALLLQAHSQGTFFFSNPGAHTRIGSIDGPLAGPGIWAQMLAGPSPSSLDPVGMPVEHLLGNGIAINGTISVPNVAPTQTAYVQMVAWDGALWGTALAGVPDDQLGRTDIVPVVLSFPIIDPVGSPHFGQPAIVPVPEPSAVALALFGGAMVWVWGRTCHRRRR